MKRFLSLIVVLGIVFTLFGCAPDNIVTPEPDNSQTDTQPQPENNPQPEIPENEPEPQPAKKEKNKNVKPTFDVDSLEYTKLKTEQLKDKTVSLYIGDNAFNAGDMTEAEWLSALKEEYGLTVDYKICADSVLYSTQSVAQKSGKNLDLISVKINDIATALSLVRSADDLVLKTDKDQFSAKVFELSGNKLFAGKGNAKMLWYNKAIVTDAPYDNWTFEDFAKISNTVKQNKNAVLETGTFAEFFSCAGTQTTGFDAQNGYILNLRDQNAQAMVSEFAKATAFESEDELSFARGNVAFTFTDTPVKRNMELSWSPLPKYTAEGENAVSLCGASLGLSKTIPEQNVDTALTFAMLWCARYTESREDTLMFDLGISKASYDEYVKLCEKNGLIYTADRKINRLLSGNIPEYFQNPETADASKINEAFDAAYARAQLINARR